MSYAQGILKAVAGKSLTAETCSRLIRALDAIPEVFHADFVAAYFKEPDQEPEEKPEDYLAVKTYTSDKFSVGDEVEFNGAYGRKRGVVLAVNGEKINIISSGGVSPDCSAFLFTRTGRNFPAIPAIMEELKKGVDRAKDTEGI